MAEDPRSRAFEALAHLLVSDHSLAESLTGVIQVVQGAVPAAAHAGMLIADHRGRASTPIYSDAEVPDMDQAQFDSGRGPCLEAWRRSTLIRIDDLATQASDHYPEFTRAALGHGVHSTVSAPLLIDDASVGALNLYSLDTAGFGPDDERLVRDIAPAAAAFVANAQAYWRAFELTEQLDDALSSRAVIDQAKGMLMARNPDLDADAAFDLLKRASHRENVKVRDIAARIVERREDPDR